MYTHFSQERCRQTIRQGLWRCCKTSNACVGQEEKSEENQMEAWKFATNSDRKFSLYMPNSLTTPQNTPDAKLGGTLQDGYLLGATEPATELAQI